MGKKKIALREEVARYIFPGTEPAIAMGEDGYVVYDFKRIYPDKLAIFIPQEVDRSNYNGVFPKSFEDYFLSVEDEIGHFLRFYELTDELKPMVGSIGAEFIPGKVLDKVKGKYTIFRFDELIGPEEKTDLLCRVQLSRLGAESELEIYNTNPCYTGNVTGSNDVRYYYWIMPISQLFKNLDEFFALKFAYANSFRHK